MTGLLAALAFLTALGLLGGRLAFWLASPEDGFLYRTAIYVLAGAVVFHLIVTLLDFLGVRWSGPLLAVLFLVLYGLGWRFLPRGPGREAPSEWGWGDGVALFAFAAFTLISLTGWNAIPDFVFHWGIKGARFALARGVDYEYLAKGWNWVLHPDYPNLLPEMFAATALLSDGFRMPAMMLEASAFFALLLVACREALRRGGADRFTRQAGLALVALAVAGFGIGHIMAGGADWIPVLAFAAALPPLLRPPDRAGDFQIAAIAAFVAAGKMEGIPLAAFLLLAQWGRRDLGERRLAWREALRMGLPMALVVLPWLGRTLHHHLFLELNSGPFTPSRAGAIAAASLEALRTPAWHGFLWAMFLPPALLFPRRTRPFAAVATLQVAFYFYVYFTSASAAEPREFVLSNFARRGFHGVPARRGAARVAWGPQRGSVTVRARL
ncbi:MAG: hypothetical protein ACJ75H_09860 [Thermoanaerobaculia bacterium]